MGAEAIDVGAATCDITPDVHKYKVPMAGYGARQGKPATGIHDRIHAKILVFIDGQRRMALVTTDLRSNTPEIKDQVVEKTKDLGFRRDNVMISASHSHDGPSFFPEPFWQFQFGKYDPAIVPPMTDAIANAIKEAVKSAAPAKIGFGQKKVEGFTHNRRWGYDTEARKKAGEKPAVNPVLSVLRVDDMNGKMKALLVHFATHPTILGADNMEISAEWPGAMKDALEATFPGIVALYVNGAEGDQSPAGAKGKDDFAKVKDFGTRLAAQAASLAKTIKAQSVPFMAYTWAKPELPHLEFSEAARKGPYRSLLPLAQDALPRSAEIQVFAIGDLALVGLPGEPICDVGLATAAAARKAGFDKVLVLGLTNDYIGYIVNKKEYAHGGYEVDERSYYGPGLGTFIAKEAGLAAAQVRETEERISQQAN